MEENYESSTNKKLDIIFAKLYKNDWKYSLELRIIGKLEKAGNDIGYGHLALKKVQIIPYQIEVLDKQNNKFEE